MKDDSRVLSCFSFSAVDALALPTTPTLLSSWVFIVCFGAPPRFLLFPYSGGKAFYFIFVSPSFPQRMMVL